MQWRSPTMGKSVIRYAFVLFSLLLAKSSAQSTTGAAAATITPPITECKSCLLEAFNTEVLSYEGDFGDKVKTIHVAKIWEIPLTDSDGRTVSISYSTEILTEIETNSQSNISTDFFTTTWTTLGTTLTFPTTYIAYEGFGVVPKCTGTASALTLAQPTDPAHLIFPSNEDFGSISSNIANYLDSLHPAGNFSDLSQCSFAVGKQQTKRRRRDLPVPVGRRRGPIFGRANGVQNNTSSVTSPTTTKVESTQSGSKYLINPTNIKPTSEVYPSVSPPSNGTNSTFLTPPAPALPSPTNVVASGLASQSVNQPEEFSIPATNFKVSVALLTDRGTKPASPISIPTPGTPNNPPVPAKPIANPDPTFGDTAVQTSAQGNNGGSPVAPERPVQTQGIGNVIASALGLTPAAGTSNGGNNGSPATPAPDSNNGRSQVANIGDTQVSIAPAAPSSGGQGVVVGGQTIQPGKAATIGGQLVSIPNGNNGAQGIVVGSQTIQPGQAATIGGQVVSVPSGNSGAQGVVVGSQTIQPGQGATINGQLVSVPSAGGNLVVGGSTIAVNGIPNTAAATPPTLTFGGNTITANPSNGFMVAPGVTASAGGPAVTVGGTTISIAPGGSIGVINGQTQSLTTNPTSAPILTLGGQAITARVSGSSTAFIIAPGQTLTPGGALTVSGTTFSLPARGSAVVVNGKTSALGASSPTAVPVLSFGAHTITASISGSSTAFIFAPGQTLTQGGSIVVSGTTFSLPVTGSAIVINGQTSMLSSPNPTLAPVLTLNGQAITASVSNGVTSFVLGPGTTLTAGGPPVVVSGTTFSLPKSGSGVIVNGQFSTLGQSGPSTTAAPALTINGHTYPATVSNGKTVYDLGSGTTLTPGGVLTLSDGTKITLASDGSSLIIGTSTSKISNVPKSTSATTTSTTSASKTDGASASATHTSKKGTASSPRTVSSFTTIAIGLSTILVAFVFLV